jgi:O-antigen/teichoic acid export membrane protein
MNLARNVTLNTAARMLTSAVEKVLVFVVMALLARRLGSEGLGVYSFALAYVTFFRLLTDWGIFPIAIKRLSAAPASERSAFFNTTLTLRAILALLGAGLAGIGFSLGGAPALVKVSVWIALLTLADVVTDVCGALLLAELKQTWLGAFEVCNRLLWSAAAIIALLLGGGVITLLVVLGCSSVVQMCSALWLVRRLIKFRFRFQWAAWKELLSNSWPLALQSIMSTVYLRIDQLFIYSLVGVAAVGHYSAATKIAEVWGLAAGVLQAATYPLMCRFYTPDRERFEKTVRYSFRYLFIAMFPVVTICTLYAPAILGFVFGEGFANAALACVLLMWAEVFLVGNMIGQAALIAAGKEKWTLALSLAAAGLNVFLNVLLIPRYGYIGAAWASLVSYGAYPVLETLLPQTRGFVCLMWKELWRPFLASVATGGLLFDFPRNGLLLFIAPVVYLVLLTMLKGVGVQDLLLLRRAVLEGAPIAVRHLPENVN